MAPNPRIGLTIRRAMERKRMNQAQLAAKLGVSRSAVNAWINDRAWPQGSIGALEDVLGISLGTEGEPVQLTDAERLELMQEYERLGKRLFGPAEPEPGAGTGGESSVHDREGRTA